MGFEGILFLGAAIANMRTDKNERGPASFRFRFFDSLRDLFGIVAIVDVAYVPIVGFKALTNVFGEAQAGGSGEGDVIVIVEKDELAEAQMAGERGGFLADAFHEVAVSADAIGIVIDKGVAGFVEAGGEPRFGYGKTDGISEALAERAGGNFNTDGMAAFGMAGSFATPLTEMFQLIERQIVTSEVQQAIEEHGAVASRKHKAVAIKPSRIFGVELQVFGPERICHCGSTHGHAGVA